MSDRFTEILDELRALHLRKSQDYGSKEDSYANVRGSEAWGIPGWLGAMVRANDKIKRLQSFAANGRLANEGVEDAFKDLAVYSIIGLILYEESANVERRGASSGIPDSTGYSGDGLANAAGRALDLERVQGIRFGKAGVV